MMFKRYVCGKSLRKRVEELERDLGHTELWDFPEDGLYGTFATNDLISAILKRLGKLEEKEMSTDYPYSDRWKYYKENVVINFDSSRKGGEFSITHARTPPEFLITTKYTGNTSDMVDFISWLFEEKK